MMMAQGKENEPADTQGRRGANELVRDYRIVCFVALVILTLILVQEGYALWSLLPLLLGCAGIAANWSLAPALVLFALMVLLMLRSWFLGIPSWFRNEPLDVAHLLLAAATFVYLGGAMRLLALGQHTVPPDARRARKPPASRVRGRWLLPKEATARASGALAGEIGILLLSAPGFVLAAYLLWIRIAVEESPPRLGILLPLWHLMLLVWGTGIALAAVYAFLAYLGRAQASREESLLFLQDQLWKETRGEQRRLNRWLVWARLRRQQQKEESSS
jgi:hypothetical protein